MNFQLTKSPDIRRMLLKTICLICATFLVTACKKEDAAEDTADYSYLFKNIIWTGELKYKTEPTQLYSAKFLADGSCLWIELTKIKKASWELDKNKLKVTFLDEPGSEQFLEARVTKDKKLTDIKITDHTGLSVLSAGVNAFTEIPLEGSTWKNNVQEVSFESAKSMSYRGIFSPASGAIYPANEWISGNFVRALGLITFPTPPRASQGSFYGQLQADGKTLRVNIFANTWIELTRQ